MANQLTVADVLAIRALLERGWSYRRIARELGVHRETVAGYDPRREARRSKPAKAPTGSEGLGDAANADGSGSDREAKPAKAPTGSGTPEVAAAPTRSDCEPHRQLILDLLEAGLSAQRIWQDLRQEHGIELSYYSVRRFVRRLGQRSPLPFRRLESAPGEQAQLDFGRGAPVIGPQGRRRRTWFFRIVLSHSRKGYTEAVHRQTTDELIRCLENAFDAFGGVPSTLVFDNAKAAVERPDWYDPELNPKLQAFCEHVGTVLLPTRPRTPRHKGKVESDVDYVKSNALKGRQFSSLAEQNEHLAHWEASVADTRIHGTTRRQVRQHFEEIERAALRPLPKERFPFFEEGTRVVHRDGHVEIARSYYPVPPEYLGRRVLVRWDARLVRIFDRRMQPIITHPRVEPGRFRIDRRCLHPHKISPVERGAGSLLHDTRLIGPQTHRWAAAMLDARGVEGVRVLVGLRQLAKKHVSAVIEEACEIAHSHGAYRLRAVRELIKRGGPKQESFEFVDDHPIIRTLGEYTEAARRAIHRTDHPGVSPATTSASESNITGAGDQDRSTGRGPGPRASPRKGSEEPSTSTCAKETNNDRIA